MNYLINNNRNLSQAEKEKILNKAVANAEMEGFVFSKEDKKTIMDLFDKKITVEQVVKQLQRKSEERIKRANGI